MAQREIYISVDIEADGPCPGINNMLSFGAAAFDLESPTPRVPIATFQANLECLPGAKADPDTAKWWDGQICVPMFGDKDTRPANQVMPEFVEWVRALPYKPIVVGYPVTFDFTFLYYYTMAFGGVEKSPFGFAGLDLKTMAMERMGTTFSNTGKRAMPKSWFEGCPKHDHVALTVAIGQGILFVNMKLEESNVI